MFRPRVIPCLLLMNSGLVKTVKFSNPQYIGDPVNAVKIFNEKSVDELILLDITASLEKRKPNISQLSRICNEAFMPLGYGGGITTLEEIKEILSLGFEKVSINSHALVNPDFIGEASAIFGSQSIVVSIDVKRDFWGRYTVVGERGTKSQNLDPVIWAREVEKRGAGELFINSVNRDGTGMGYDYELIKMIAEAVNIPVIACGGAGKISDFTKAIKECGASAVSAGSLFVFHGKHRAVLITFPSEEELEEAFS